MSKTVYILGAGASAAANLPIQKKLITEIFSLTFDKIPKSKSILDKNSTLIAHYSNFEISRRYLSDFLITIFGESSLVNFYKEKKISSSNTPEALKMFFEENLLQNNNFWLYIYKCLSKMDIPLEDIFTFLDKSKTNNEFFKAYTTNELTQINMDFKSCIIYILSYYIEVNKSTSLYDDIADKLITKRLSEQQDSDPFSIITLNWDTLIDYHINKKCIEYNNNSIHSNSKIYPDYCFYNYDLKKSTPSTLVKSHGNYNIKILKLHGSINWLECPNCGKVYTDFNDSISLKSMNIRSDHNHFLGSPISFQTCKYCYKIGNISIGRPMIITPTFLKTFNSFALKNIWQNAYIELSEATEVVFIGYSFPDADFELRYMLKKALQKNCKITVILHKSDNINHYKEEFTKLLDTDLLSGLDSYTKTSFNKSLENTLLTTLKKFTFPQQRYKAFFADKEITFSYEGIENYSF